MSGRHPPMHSQTPRRNWEAAKASQAKAAQQQIMAQQQGPGGRLDAQRPGVRQKGQRIAGKASRPMRCYQKSSPDSILSPPRDRRSFGDEHEARSATFYADLSSGERWRIALDIAIQAVGTGGLLVIPQEAWEDWTRRIGTRLQKQAKASRGHSDGRMF